MNLSVKRNDIMIIGILIALSLFSFLILRVKPGNSRNDYGIIEIYENEDLYQSVLLDGSEQTIIIRQDNGCENRIHITKQGAYMEYSSCRNQICVDQGEVNQKNHLTRGMGDWIICIPNKISIKYKEPE